jgi:hypothetical protein
MQKKYRLLLTIAFFITLSFLVAKVQTSLSANLTSVSVTLSNSRPSFLTALEGAHTGLALLTIDTSNYPSANTYSVMATETLYIGTGTTNSYTVANTPSTSTIELTSSLAATDDDDDDTVYFNSTSATTVKLTTVSALAAGSFRILVPAATTDADSHDGVPDQDTWDGTVGTPTITCPSDGQAHGTFTAEAVAYSQTTAGGEYHIFECSYDGAGAASTAFDGGSNGSFVLSSMINPAPSAGHTVGTADTFSFIMQHLDSGDNIIDSTTVKVGVIEAVKVTAEVAPQITFTVAGIGTTTVCGVTTDVVTTANSVPFGELSISAFGEAAQELTVSTNAASGYTVTALANDQLGKDGATCTGDTYGAVDTCIWDANVASMTHTTSQDWTSTTEKGFGYTLHDDDADATEAFYYNESARAFSAKHFADNEDSQPTQTIFSSSGTADAEDVFVCYRILPDVDTTSGDYENYITYTATANF